MSFFRRKSLFIILLGIILMVVLIGYSLTNKDNLSKPEQFIKDSVGWVQGIVYKPVELVVGSFSNVKELKSTYEENQLLRKKIAEYKTLVFDNKKLKNENEELREALDINESSRDYNPINSTVISRSPERWLEQITIDRGKTHGVEDNMAVITADGMVGKVKKASNLTSTVQLLTGFDQLNRISAIVKRDKGKDVFGLVEKYDSETESLVFRVIEDSKEKLKKGELVVTSNLGGSYPENLLIGEVKEVVPDQYGLTKTALIKPAANMYELNNVIVVDRSLLTGQEINQDEEESSPPEEEKEEEINEPIDTEEEEL